MVAEVFVGRERELARLDTFLEQAVAGHGQVVFVSGEAGTGKTALLQEFARHSQVKHDELVMAGGNCNAYTGVGDPYLPFRDVLVALTGLSGRGVVQPANAQAANPLATLFARSVQVLVEVGPDLIGTFVPGASLLGTIEGRGGEGRLVG
jgi:hypothetical protein